MIREHQVSQAEASLRLDKLLSTLEPNYSRHQIQHWIKTGFVLVDDREVKANYKCKTDDKISLSIPEVKTVEIKAEPIDLEILYEDDYLLVINKPKGMLVHPTRHINTGTLVNALKYHCQTLSNLSGDERPGIVHRLDKDTSGVLVAAKDNGTHEHLKKQFKDHTVTRIYEAIVFGVIGPNHGIIKAPIGRNPTNRLKRTVVEGGKEAETKFDVLQRFHQYTHVQCELFTGRTHQIRVHMKYMNHPIVGDELYCRKKSQLVHGQALFARELQFVHPQTQKHLTFTVKQPSYFNTLIKKLEKMA